MKRPLCLIILLICLCVTFLEAQESVPARQIPAEELVRQRHGKIIDFQKLLRRYETAVKENDVASAKDLQTDLVKEMKKRVDEVAAEKVLDETQSAVLKEQQLILKSVETFDFSGKSEDFNKAVEHLRKIQQFGRLMENNFVTQ